MFKLQCFVSIEILWFKIKHIQPLTEPKVIHKINHKVKNRHPVLISGSRNLMFFSDKNSVHPVLCVTSSRAF